MTWVISMVVSLISGALGLFLAGAIANVSVRWYHIPTREGGAGYFVLLTGLAGGVAGLIIGLLVARLIAAYGGPGFARELGGAVGAVGLIAGIAAILCRLMADVAPQIDGRDLNLEVEFRFPADPKQMAAPTADGEWKVQLSSVQGGRLRAAQAGVIQTNAARVDQGRWIVPTVVPLFSERGQRVILLQQGDRDVGGFLVALPSHPGDRYEQWSDWLPRQQADGSAWPEQKLSYRFRVQKEPLPPRPMTEAESKAEKAARQENEFAALSGDSPLAAWFPYVAYPQPQTERALQHIVQRPGLVREITDLALGDDAELAGQALRCLAQHPAPPAEFLQPMAAIGGDLAERLRQFNRTTVEQDPSYLGAADISQRFHGWIDAARALRKSCGGDFVPELKTILELSRERPDSHALRQDVCRVASFYLHEWAGIAPLPSDPKPR